MNIPELEKEFQPQPKNRIRIEVRQNPKVETEKETISSLLDLDLYKMTMGQFVWENFADTQVKYSFINRNKSVRLADFVSQNVLEQHFEKIQKLKISSEEIGYLENVEVRGQKLFSRDYLNFLKQLRMPKVEVKEKEGQFGITISGSWAQTIYWETFILSTVNELYYREVQNRSGRTENDVKTEGRKRLNNKITKLKDFIESEKNSGYEGPFFMDFGTRRRFSREWQEEVVETVAREIPYNFTGTSNVNLGRKFDLPIKGTYAHEMDMVFSGIFHQLDDEARKFVSHDKLMEMWFERYGAPLSIALTDTYGTDYFLRNFSKKQANEWIGLRQDSGDPIQFGEKIINFYKSNNIDPREKTIVFSDGLDVDQIIKIYSHFKGKIRMIFGWGTTLTNDMGFDTLSLVVKATEANGFETVKLSDNVAKATGTEASIERAIRKSRYVGNFYQDTKV